MRPLRPGRPGVCVPQIEFHGVTKRFDNGQEALVNVDAEFAEGSIAFLTGHSGAGKSTFLKLL